MDDAASCAALYQMMSAFKMRGIRPRRTIRIVYFTGEEQGKVLRHKSRAFVNYVQVY